MSNNEMNINFTIKITKSKSSLDKTELSKDPSSSLSLESYSESLVPTSLHSSNSGLTPRVISITIDNEDIKVFPDSSYISPKLTSKPPVEPPPLKRCYSIGRDPNNRVFPDSSYISPKTQEKCSLENVRGPPAIKRSRSSVLSSNLFVKKQKNKETIESNTDVYEDGDQEEIDNKKMDDKKMDDEKEKEKDEEEKDEEEKDKEEEDGEEEDDEEEDDEEEDDEEEDDDEDDKDKDEVYDELKYGPKYKIKIPVNFNSFHPKSVITFLRGLNKREFNFIMSRGFIVRPGDLHDKRIKKVLLQLRNYHG